MLDALLNVAIQLKLLDFAILYGYIVKIVKR